MGSQSSKDEIVYEDEELRKLQLEKKSRKKVLDYSFLTIFGVALGYAMWRRVVHIRGGTDDPTRQFVHPFVFLFSFSNGGNRFQFSKKKEK